jgi:hypothetical protein
MDYQELFKEILINDSNLAMHHAKFISVLLTRYSIIPKSLSLFIKDRRLDQDKLEGHVFTSIEFKKILLTCQIYSKLVGSYSLSESFGYLMDQYEKDFNKLPSSLQKDYDTIVLKTQSLNDNIIGLTWDNNEKTSKIKELNELTESLTSQVKVEKLRCSCFEQSLKTANEKIDKHKDTSKQVTELLREDKF